MTNSTFNSSHLIHAIANYYKLAIICSRLMPLESCEISLHKNPSFIALAIYDRYIFITKPEIDLLFKIISLNSLFSL